jgi:hypothetical protein
MPFEFSKQQGYGSHRWGSEARLVELPQNRPRLGGKESARKRGIKVCPYNEVASYLRGQHRRT